MVHHQGAAHHLKRLACLYVRQSTLQQVFENTESTARQDELVQRAQEAQRLRHLQVERAQYEADLAQRRYLRVDPDNRLVATVLEAEWNTKLRELEEARVIEEQYKQSDQYQVSPEERSEIDGTPECLRQFWENPTTAARQRKRAVRLVIEDVIVHKSDQIVAHIRFKGGATQTIIVPLPPPFAQSRLTAPKPWLRWIAYWRSTQMQRLQNTSICKGIGPLMDSFFRVSTSINCVAIIASQIGMHDYGLKGC